MNPDAIPRLFKEAYNTFPPLEGKPAKPRAFTEVNEMDIN
jgi:hypothetical protein